jgi:hypothetical protein
MGLYVVRGTVMTRRNGDVWRAALCQAVGLRLDKAILVRSWASRKHPPGAAVMTGTYHGMHSKFVEAVETKTFSGYESISDRRADDLEVSLRDLITGGTHRTSWIFNETAAEELDRLAKAFVSIEAILAPENRDQLSLDALALISAGASLIDAQAMLRGHVRDVDAPIERRIEREIAPGVPMEELIPAWGSWA